MKHYRNKSNTIKFPDSWQRLHFLCIFALGENSQPNLTSHISSHSSEEESYSAAWKCMPYVASSPICTAGKAGLIICCGCYWARLVWGNNILARLVNSATLQFFHPPAFSLCLRLSLHKPPNSLVSRAAFSLLFFKLCHFVSYSGCRLSLFLIWPSRFTPQPPLPTLLRYCGPLSQFTHVWPIAHWINLSNEHSKDVLHTAQFHTQLVNWQSVSNREHSVFDEN